MITPGLIRAARGLLDWTQAELARRTGLSPAAVSKIEQGTSKPYASSLDRIRIALEGAGVIFTFDPCLGVRLRGAAAGEAALLSERTPAPAQIRAARLFLGWTQKELCHRVGLSEPAMVRIEHGVSNPMNVTLASIRRAFEAAGVEFTNSDEPGVRLRKVVIE